MPKLSPGQSSGPAWPGSSSGGLFAEQQKKEGVPHSTVSHSITPTYSVEHAPCCDPLWGSYALQSKPARERGRKRARERERGRSGCCDAEDGEVTGDACPACLHGVQRWASAELDAEHEGTAQSLIVETPTCKGSSKFMIVPVHNFNGGFGEGEREPFVRCECVR